MSYARGEARRNAVGGWLTTIGERRLGRVGGDQRTKRCRRSHRDPSGALDIGWLSDGRRRQGYVGALAARGVVCLRTRGGVGVVGTRDEAVARRGLVARFAHLDDDASVGLEAEHAAFGRAPGEEVGDQEDDEQNA